MLCDAIMEIIFQFLLCTYLIFILTLRPFYFVGDILRLQLQKETMETFRFVDVHSSNHFHFLSNSLTKLRKGKHTCDVKVQVKEGHVYAHRAVLVSFSPYFYSSLYGEFEDSVVNKTSLVGSIDLSSFESDHVELMVSTTVRPMFLWTSNRLLSFLD